VESTNAILEEQQDFLQAVRGGAPVRVDGRQACEALRVAERVLHSIHRHRWTTPAAYRKAG
jgi:predicted dehydrogenase